MHSKRFVVSVLVVFLTYEILDVFIHMVILRDIYAEHSALWRQDMENTAWLLILTALVQSIFFVYFYSLGFENKGFGEGIRYGLIFGLLMSFVGIFNQYAVYPVPLWLAWQWFAYGLVRFMVCGIAVSLVFQKKGKATG